MKINIYLTKEQRAQLTAVMYKYQVSKSTIAEKCLFHLTHYLNIEGKKETIEKIGTEYLYEKGGKTSIKPKSTQVLKTFYKNLSRAFTNVLVMYLQKDFNKYVEHTKELLNDINTALQKTDEYNWDYSQFIKSMWKYERKKQNA